MEEKFDDAAETEAMMQGSFALELEGIPSRTFLPRRRLAIFTTGGTIDKVYFDAKSKYSIGAPIARELLKKARVDPMPAIVELMRKDSLEMDASDRQRIRRAIQKCAANAIVVTHGTDTLTETAEFLLDVGNKTIVLAGALQPGRFIGSDAAFNVGTAVGAALSLPEGVYVAANGKLYAGGTVRKNRARSRFEALDSSHRGTR